MCARPFGIMLSILRLAQIDNMQFGRASFFAWMFLFTRIDEITTTKAKSDIIIFIHTSQSYCECDLYEMSLIWFKIKTICLNWIENMQRLDYNATVMERCKCHSKSVKKYINAKINNMHSILLLPEMFPFYILSAWSECSRWIECGMCMLLFRDTER